MRLALFIPAHRWLASRRFLCAGMLWLLSGFAIPPTFADGCFVYKWDERADIQEPTQKAILLHDAGREDLLLQVKYTGPLEEFGWLIPVPARPTVGPGSMAAFYELSQLTQRHASFQSRTGGETKVDGTKPAVEVIEIKTVGAYEIAVLSARDADGLAQWLRSHGYAIPHGNGEIIADYLRKGWYFIAARIRLDRGIAFTASQPSQLPALPPAPNRKTLRRELTQGELHPLLISFDTPQCVFPLRISAVGGKPSEISLYVLSAAPLLNSFLFHEARAQLRQRRAEWDEGGAQREKYRQTSVENSQILQINDLLRRPGSIVLNGNRPRWSVADLRALVREQYRPPRSSLEDEFFSTPNELLVYQRLAPVHIVQTAQCLPRLQGKSWYLTKLTRTFAPEEMQDLVFVPAIPALAPLLSESIGKTAAQVLDSFGSDSLPSFIAASQSHDETERANAACGFITLTNQQRVEPLVKLLQDTAPRARWQAIQAAAVQWDPRFTQPLIALFQDPYPEIRSAATWALANHEHRKRTSWYRQLLKHPDVQVRIGALKVLSVLHRESIPDKTLIELLNDPNDDLRLAALEAISRLQRKTIPRSALLPLLGSPRTDVIYLTKVVIENGELDSRPQPTAPFPLKTAPERHFQRLASAEAAPLTTHRLACIRLLGLRALEKNADAPAIELVLPRLKDSHVIVRDRAHTVMQSITGARDVRASPKAWENWWSKHRANFRPSHAEP
jgi:HEAT repeat protein